MTNLKDGINQNNFLSIKNNKYNNFSLVKQKNKYWFFYLIKNEERKNKSFYKICVEVINILEGGNFIIKILNDYKDFNLRKDDNVKLFSNY